jgi:uncharacterized pyridoxal phosphate-containing UPF0001 family protein
VGQLQRNKARSVASYAHLVHSVDRCRWSRPCPAAPNGRREVGVLLQVSLDGTAARARRAEVPALADAVAAARACPGGVMASGPATPIQGAAFERSRGWPPGCGPTTRAVEVSAGMTAPRAVRSPPRHDRACAHGVLGQRPPLSR